MKLETDEKDVKISELTELLRWLIEEADFNIEESCYCLGGSDFVLSVIECSDIETLKYLHSLDKTLVKATNHDSDTALCIAVQESRNETIKNLLEDIKIDIKETCYNGRNCVLKAVSADRLDILKHLHSIDDTLIMAKDHDGETALCLACRFVSKSMVEYWPN